MILAVLLMPSPIIHDVSAPNGLPIVDLVGRSWVSKECPQTWSIHIDEPVLKTFVLKVKLFMKRRSAFDVAEGC